MLILRRKEGQWVELTHRSGDVIRVRFCNIRNRYPGQVDVVFDDTARNFIIERPERAAKALAPSLEDYIELAATCGPWRLTPPEVAGEPAITGDMP